MPKEWIKPKEMPHLDQVFFMVSESKYPSGSLPFPSTLGRFESRSRMQFRAGVVLSLF